MDGNAVIKAAADLREKIKVFAAAQLEVKPEELEVADNKVFVKDDPAREMAMVDVGAASNWGGEFLVGIGRVHTGRGVRISILKPEK